ncbi:MAG: hypothetical protein IT273_07440 [Chitinophagales bacterium]|nr:hypothetical protein [Chitinophagales bacterium]
MPLSQVVRTAAVCPRAGASPEFRPAPLDAGYGRLCIVGGGFRLDVQKFTRYEALNRPFAISRLT